MMEELYNAASSEKEKLTIEGAGHDDAYIVNPELYWDTISKFLKNHVN